jgi:DNA mismatch endonuclease, patch repair protein
MQPTRSDQISMPDPAADVSRRMRATPRRDTAPELAIRSALHRRGWRYRVDARPEPSLRTRADLVFATRRTAVFVDGCWWHGCPTHYTTPTTRGDWWDAKVAANRARDAAATKALEAHGWTVVRVWEHTSTDDAVEIIERALHAGDR